MANGLYGQLSPAAGVLTKATTSAVPAGKTRSVILGVCNTSEESTAKIYIAVTDAPTAAAVPAASYKSSGRKLGPGDEYERSVLLGVGENVWFKSDKAGVTFDVRGFEGDAV
jgi:hypothetical protein